MHFLNHGRAPVSGALLSRLALGAMGEPPAHGWSRGCCLGMRAERGPGIPLIPSPSLASHCPFPLDAGGRAELGPVPPCSPHTQAVSPPRMCCGSQEASRACWENASTGLFCISN